MALISFSGELAADPVSKDSELVHGTIAELVVIERTGRYLRGEWVEDAVPTIRYVRTDVQATQTVIDTLRAGTHVLVTGLERVQMRTVDGAETEVRVVDAARIGVLLAAQQTVTVTVNPGPGRWWPVEY